MVGAREGAQVAKDPPSYVGGCSRSAFRAARERFGLVRGLKPDYPIFDSLFQQTQRDGGIAEHLIVELADVEFITQFLRGVGAEFRDFEFADFLGERLAGPDDVTRLMD